MDAFYLSASQQASFQGKHAEWLAIQELNMIWLVY